MRFPAVKGKIPLMAFIQHDFTLFSLHDKGIAGECLVGKSKNAKPIEIDVKNIL